MSNASLRDHECTQNRMRIARIIFLYACLGFYLGTALWLIPEINSAMGGLE